MADTQEPGLIWVNGQEHAMLPAWDRGLAYGDGIFETIRVENGGMPLWPLHRARLERGIQTLRLPIDAAGRNRLLQELQAFGRVLEQGVCKLMLTRGWSGNGYDPSAATDCNRVLLGTRIDFDPASRRTALRLRRCQLRLALQPHLAGIKHLNRLEQVLARGECAAQSCDEGLLFDPEGNLVEATAGNVFVEFDEQLHTPQLDQCGVEGVFRAWLLERLQRVGIAVTVGRIGEPELERMQGMLICNAVQGARTVAELDGKPVPAGALTRQASALAADAFVTGKQR